MPEQNTQLFDRTVFFHHDPIWQETQAYSYYIEYGTGAGGFDDVVIADAIGRLVPIDMESIPELILALQEILNINEKIDAADRLLQQVADENHAIAVEAP